MKHKGILSSVNGTTLTLSLLQFGQTGRRIQKKKAKERKYYLGGGWHGPGGAASPAAGPSTLSFSEFLGVSRSFAAFRIGGAQRGGKKSFGHLSNLWSDLEPALGKSSLSAGRECVETNC